MNDSKSAEFILSVHDLSRQIPDGDGWLLQNISMQLHPGERLGLIGPTGSGKTVLLRCLALLDPIDSGEILWEGQLINDVPAFRRKVIYVHQRPAHIEGDVEMNLRLPFDLRTSRGRQFNRERVLTFLESLGRQESFLRKPHTDLSGGEAQIAALLRAVQLDPQVLLLDEPTAALDSKAAQAVEQLVQKWCGDEPGRAYIWVSHQKEQVSRVTNRMLEMIEGSLRNRERDAC